MTDAAKIDALQKTMGEPVGFDISEAAAKIKRNLILVSSVVLVLIFGGVEAAPGFSIFGVSLTGVTSTKLMIGLSVVFLYSLTHYLWYCYELYSEWAIRLTGAKLGFVTAGTFGAEGMDYPSDPKQSTLYNWWRQQSRALVDYKEIASKVDEQVSQINLRIDEIIKNENPDANGAMAHQAIVMLNTTMGQIHSSIVSTESILTQARVPVSLARFDRRFGLLLKSQNLRIF
ncbi:hypothetical protein [Pseudomonas sp. B21-021]|nr:hypothetical protein [Pseudomonas sp. B21-021]UVM29927.1 hypothetical protein LOY31_12935 [Pseudomonas sp. B21-021]